jgi:hypothetical protein
MIGFDWPSQPTILGVVSVVCMMLFVLCGGVVVRPVWWRATIVAQVATVGALLPDISFCAGMRACHSPKLLG